MIHMRTMEKTFLWNCSNADFLEDQGCPVRKTTHNKKLNVDAHNLEP